MNVRRMLYAALVLFMVQACGSEAQNNGASGANNGGVGGNNGGAAGFSCEGFFAADDGAGVACATSEDCVEIECPCSGDTVSNSSCFNGTCEGRDTCDDACQTFGKSYDCANYDPDAGSGNNGVANNGDMTTTPPQMCDRDLTPLQDSNWDLQCLSDNCCEKAAACAVLATCPTYEACVNVCADPNFGGDYSECVRACAEDHPQGNEPYGPFFSCANSAGC